MRLNTPQLQLQMQLCLLINICMLLYRTRQREPTIERLGCLHGVKGLKLVINVLERNWGNVLGMEEIK